MSSSPSFFFWVEFIAIIVVGVSMVVGGLAYRRQLDPKKKAIGAIVACLGGIILLLIGGMVLLSAMIAGSISG